jgi:uncharacterized membrane protein
MSDVHTEDEADVEEYGADVPTVPMWWPIVALVLSLIGFGISLYLTLDHFQGRAPICASSGFVDCKKVTTSSWSYVFGIPVSLLGLIFYTGMVAINWPGLWRTPARWVAWARLGLAVSGVGFVLYLIAAELLSIKAICLWCTGVHITTFLLFVLVVVSFPLMSGRSSPWQEWSEDGADT